MAATAYSNACYASAHPAARPTPRRGGHTMRSLTCGVATALMLGLVATVAQAQSWRPPADNQRCPSKWGAGDERGAGNHMKPATVMKAAQLIKTGEIIEIGHPYGPEMPLSSTRQFNVHTKRTFMN